MELSGNAKVDHGDAAVWLEHHVRGLHVAIDDRGIQLVQVLEDVAELDGLARYRVLGLRSHREDHVGERAALYVIHDHVERARLVDDVYDARNRG